ncbi:MAG: biopolymer transporter ExbD [Longimicrobiales bacterium]|nr:biopolymer transporter ExbD [Longimicrobiales bacterium]
MPRRLSGRGGDLDLQAEINVTSLVDVAFTLLVIFIITAPILQGGIEVDVPSAEVSPLQPSDDPVFVSIDADDRIFLEETEFESVEAFRASFADLAAAGHWEVVYLRADRRSTMDVVLPVIGVINATEGVSPALVGEFLNEGR